MFGFDWTVRIYGTAGWTATDEESEVLKTTVEGLPGVSWMDVRSSGIWEELKLGKPADEDFPIRVARAQFRKQYLLRCAFALDEIDELRNLSSLLRSNYLFLYGIRTPYAFHKPGYTVATVCVGWKTTHKGGIKIVEIELVRRKADG